MTVYKENKHRFITLLQYHLERQGCHTAQATADADLLIVKLPLLLQKTCQTLRSWLATKTQTYLSCFASTPKTHLEHILSTRAKALGKTSTQVLDHCFSQNNDSSTNASFKGYAQVFNDHQASKADLISAGEDALVALYKGRPGDKLDRVNNCMVTVKLY